MTVHRSGLLLLTLSLLAGCGKEPEPSSIPLDMVFPDLATPTPLPTATPLPTPGPTPLPPPTPTPTPTCVEIQRELFFKDFYDAQANMRIRLEESYQEKLPFEDVGATGEFRLQNGVLVSAELLPQEGYDLVLKTATETHRIDVRSLEASFRFRVDPGFREEILTSIATIEAREELQGKYKVKAFQLSKKEALKTGDHDLFFNYAELCDPQTRFFLLGTLANNHHHPSQRELAKLYFSGLVTPVNQPLAETYLKKAARGGEILKPLTSIRI